MSLMQLLAMGKSIRTIEDRPTPYKIRARNLVPKFRSTVWPTMKRLEVLPRPAEVEEEEGPAAREEAMVGSHPTAEAAAGSPEAVERYARPAYPLGRWTTTGKPVTWRNPSVTAPQGELGLDGVRVIRNDLQDADLELVPEKVEWPVAVGAAWDRWQEMLQPWRRLRTWLERVKRAH